MEHAWDYIPRWNSQRYTDYANAESNIKLIVWSEERIQLFLIQTHSTIMPRAKKRLNSSVNTCIYLLEHTTEYLSYLRLVFGSEVLACDACSIFENFALNSLPYSRTISDSVVVVFCRLLSRSRMLRVSTQSFYCLLIGWNTHPKIKYSLLLSPTSVSHNRSQIEIMWTFQTALHLV